MATTGEKIATFFIYFGALTILIWALLKSLHVIGSPVWVEMVPYFGGGASLLAIAYQAGKVMQNVDEMAKEIKKITNLSDRILKIETRCEERHK